MAWTTINYSCGHVGQVQMYGKHSERGRKVVWMEKNVLCDECAAKARDEGNRKAAATNAEAGLPSLTGTEKQVAWAESLRRAAYQLLTADKAAMEIVSRVVTRGQSLGLTPEMLKAAHIDSRETAAAMLRELIGKMFAAQVTASFWINNREQAHRPCNNLTDVDKLVDLLVEQFAAAVKAAPAPKRAAKIGEIMRRAWQIARDAAAKLGCALKEIVFGACLKQAWAEARA